MFAVTCLTAHAGIVSIVGAMLLVGIGLGLVMQVLVIAVQNAVDHRDLGVATSGTTLFRLIGGSLGTAALGVVFSARLARELAAIGGAGLLAGGSSTGLTPGAIAALPDALRATYTGAFASATHAAFVVAASVAAAGFVLSWLLPERALRETVAHRAAEVGAEMGEAVPLPR